jgi:hypothetical protein
MSLADTNTVTTADRPTRKPIDLLLRDLRYSRDGLGQREAARRLAMYGANQLPRASRWELAR